MYKQYIALGMSLLYTLLKILGENSLVYFFFLGGGLL